MPTFVAGSYGRILIAIEPGPKAEAVLRRGTDVADLHRARVSVLHVVHDDTINAMCGLDARVRTTLRNRLQGDVNRDIECLVSKLGSRKAAIDIHIDEGAPATTITAVANRIGADLIVMGVNDRRSFRDRIVGTTTDRVVRTVQAPVLVVKRPCETRYRHVVVAVDFSLPAEMAAEKVASLCAGAPLRLIHVSHVPMQFEQVLIKTGASAKSIAEYHRSRLVDARQKIAELATKFDDREPKPETKVVEGDPTATLINLSRSRHVDLLALGAKSRGPVAQLLIGSVARKLLREAACDVFLAGTMP